MKMKLDHDARPGAAYPTIGVGRLAAAALMVACLALLGVVTAPFASWLTEQVAVKELEETVDLRSEVAALHAKIDLLLARAGRASGGSNHRLMTFGHPRGSLKGSLVVGVAGSVSEANHYRINDRRVWLS